jgi:hypothetical protein
MLLKVDNVIGVDFVASFSTNSSTVQYLSYDNNISMVCQSYSIKNMKTLIIITIFFSGWGLNPGPYIYYALSLSTITIFFL